MWGSLISYDIPRVHSNNMGGGGGGGGSHLLDM